MVRRVDATPTEHEDDVLPPDDADVWSVPDDRFDTAYLFNRTGHIPLLTPAQEINIGQDMIKQAGEVSHVFIHSKTSRNLVYQCLRAASSSTDALKRTLRIPPNQEDTLLDKMHAIISMHSKASIQTTQIKPLEDMLFHYPLSYPTVHAIVETSGIMKQSESLRKKLQSPMATWEELRHQLCLANIRLVGSISKRYMRSGIERARLMSTGIAGLFNAIDRFWPGKFRFATYATWWIRQAMGNEAKIFQEERSTTSFSGHRSIISLDQVQDDESEFGLLDALGAKQETREKHDGLRTALIANLRLLSPRERFVICLRNGVSIEDIVPPDFYADMNIITDECHTMEGVAALLGISKERVRQIQNKAYKRLRAPTNPRRDELQYLLEDKD